MSDPFHDSLKCLKKKDLEEVWVDCWQYKTCQMWPRWSKKRGNHLIVIERFSLYRGKGI
jgi:hypothetical protein